MLMMFSASTLIYAALLFAVAALRHFLDNNQPLQYARVYCHTHLHTDSIR